MSRLPGFLLVASLVLTTAMVRGQDDTVEPGPPTTLIAAEIRFLEHLLLNYTYTATADIESEPPASITYQIDVIALFNYNMVTYNSTGTIPGDFGSTILSVRDMFQQIFTGNLVVVPSADGRALYDAAYGFPVTTRRKLYGGSGPMTQTTILRLTPREVDVVRKKDLDMNNEQLAQWNALGWSSYNYYYEEDCQTAAASLCQTDHPHLTMPVLVHVVKGEVQSAIDATTKEVLPTGKYALMDGYFSISESRILQATPETNTGLRYDANAHYPTFIPSPTTATGATVPAIYISRVAMDDRSDDADHDRTYVFIIVFVVILCLLSIILGIVCMKSREAKDEAKTNRQFAMEDARAPPGGITPSPQPPRPAVATGPQRAGGRTTMRDVDYAADTAEMDDIAPRASAAPPAEPTKRAASYDI